MKVKSIKFNWHQVGSTETRDGAGADWEQFMVGEKEVIKITEYQPLYANDLWSYVVILNDKTEYRIFNPSFVEYFSKEKQP